MVRVVSRSIPPPWRSIRFRLAPRTYDAPPWGCIVRVVSQTKSRKKYPPEKWYCSFACRNMLPRFCVGRAGGVQQLVHAGRGTRLEPFNFTPMAVNSISSGSPHVRPMGRTCGEPDEIKKNTHPKNITTLFREQDNTTCHTPFVKEACRRPRGAPNRACVGGCFPSFCRSVGSSIRTEGPPMKGVRRTCR